MQVKYSKITTRYAVSKRFTDELKTLQDQSLDTSYNKIDGNSTDLLELKGSSDY